MFNIHRFSAYTVVSRLTYFIRRDDCMFRHGNCPKGLIFASFGLGIMLGLYFPVKAMLFILALMLVALGIFSCQR